MSYLPQLSDRLKEALKPLIACLSSLEGLTCNLLVLDYPNTQVLIDYLRSDDTPNKIITNSTIIAEYIAKVWPETNIHVFGYTLGEQGVIRSEATG